MPKTFERRSEESIAEEQAYLQKRSLEIEKMMGQVAARHPAATPITQPLDALDRARELANDMYKQVRVRPLEDAIDAQLTWLDRVEAKQSADDGEPKVEYNKIPLDRRLLKELLEGWRNQP